MTQTIEEILASSDDPAFVRVEVARIPRIPQALREEHAAKDARLRELRAKRDTVDISDEQRELADRVIELEAQMEAAVVEFRFKGIGHRAWQDLVRDHPPTKEQLGRNKDLDMNPETFPHAAIAASCIDPVMTVAQVNELEQMPWVDVAAWMALWTTCLRANVGQSVPKSTAAGLILRRNGASEPRLTNSESPDPSSLVAS